MNYPSRHVADLVKWGKQHDIVYEGVVKSGHVRFRLPDGTFYTTASTPSEVHATQSAMRDMCRLIGVTYESGRKSGRHKRGTRRGKFTPATVRTDSVSARYERLAASHQDVCDQIRRMQITGARSDGKSAAIRRLLAIEAQIEQLGREAPLRTFRVLNTQEA